MVLLPCESRSLRRKVMKIATQHQKEPNLEVRGVNHVTGSVCFLRSPLSLRSKEKKLCGVTGVGCGRVPLGWRFPGSHHAEVHMFEAPEECPVIGCFELLFPSLP